MKSSESKKYSSPEMFVVSGCLLSAVLAGSGTEGLSENGTIHYDDDVFDEW